MAITYVRVDAQKRIPSINSYWLNTKQERNTRKHMSRYVCEPIFLFERHTCEEAASQCCCERLLSNASRCPNLFVNCSERRITNHCRYQPAVCFSQRCRAAPCCVSIRSRIVSVSRCAVLRAAVMPAPSHGRREFTVSAELVRAWV